VRTAMMTAEPMITRGVHYTAVVDTIDHQGAAKLHAREREQLLEAADVLLFGEPDSKWAVRAAEVLIKALESSERWSVESCDLLREHLSGCDAPTGAS
jgi:1,2-phenylacetyl-CoA epoxidase PaaB subunit